MKPAGRRAAAVASGRKAAVLALGLGAIALATAALAYVPPVDRIARMAADASRVHGRAQPLSIRIVVRAEGGETLASGTLESDPRGVARLELRHEGGFVERQLRQGKAVSASRDREELPDAHPLLPPLWLLQTGSGAALQTRIAELGGDPEAVALGFDGDSDCFVLGGRTSGASYWVDQESFAPVRIELPGGVRYRLGPPRTQGGIELPATITLEAPGRPAVTLSLEAARPSPLPPDAFAPAWLTAN